MTNKLPLSEKSLLRQALVCLITGAAWMGFSTAAVVGLVAYSDTSSGPIGSARSWAPIMAVVGCVVGAIAGSAFGFFIGLLTIGKKKSAMFGAFYGMALGIGLVIYTGVNYSDREMIAIAALLIPVGATTGYRTSPVDPDKTKDSDESRLGPS